MLKNYLTIATRNLLKQKGLAFINIFGLAVGLASFCLFLLYAVNEFSFDRFHENSDTIYQVYRWSEPLSGREASADAFLPLPLGPAMQEHLPDVEAYVRFRTEWGDELIRIDGQIHREGVMFTDTQVFDVFTFPLRAGNPSRALADPGNIVLSVSMAERLFGRPDPLGETLEVQLDGTYEPFIVSAVAEDMPPNSTIVFGILASYERLPSRERYEDIWNRSAFPTFVKLRAGSTLPEEADRLLAFRRQFYPNEEASLRERGYWEGEGPPVTYGLQPLTAMHTDTRIASGFVPTVDPANVWLLLAIAAGVLLIVCINFTTLSIGRSAGRAREVGVRKAIGSDRRALVVQFLLEALLMSTVAAVAGLVLCYLLLPMFNTLAGRELVFSLRLFPELGWLIAGITLLVGIVSGSYPAFVLSRFRPVEVLKHSVRVGGSNALTRTLVTVQFAVSIGLIAASVVIVQQVEFLRAKSPGFDQENVVMVDAQGTESGVLYERFKQVVAGRPEILGVASAELGIGEGMGYSVSGWDYRGETKETYENYVDDGYIDVLGLELVAGRPFSDVRAADTTESVIVNETFVRYFGWTNEAAIGQPLSGYSSSFTPIVIGVVRDWHFQSFHVDVAPQLFHQFSDYAPYQYFVRLAPGDPSGALAVLREAWASVAPGMPFTYRFLDASLDDFYRAESRFGTIVAWAGGLSVVLACLGVFGLVALATVNRTKEIGIRKVLGATVGSLVGLLARDFVVQVLVAALVATPLAWWVLQHWLEGFAYRIGLQGWHFVLAGLVALVATVLTVSYQATRAALADPATSLRYE